MEIPVEILWGGISVLGTIIGWLIALERRLNARLTRNEHTQICDKANAVLDKKLERILTTLEKQNESTLSHRQWMGDAVGVIRSQLAVVRDRLKISDEEHSR